MVVSFEVFGEPKPQGSSRAFVVNGRAVITSANKNLKPWRQQVSWTAAAEMTGKNTMEGPVDVSAIFTFVKPKSTPKKVVDKTTKPDLDKLLRAVLDSLTGHCFRDDAQVVSIGCSKRFGDKPGVKITVTGLDDAA